MDKTDLLLLLLYANSTEKRKNEPVTGITRLVKLLFLLQEEAKIDGYRFVPYKMGPFSNEVYNQIEFLKNFPSPENPLIKVSQNKSTSTGMNPEELKYLDEIAEVESIDSGVTVEEKIDGSEVNVTYSLTELGERMANELWQSQNDDIQNKITTVKGKYGSISLKQLLKYVYSNYPNMTVNSEIKDQVMN